MHLHRWLCWGRPCAHVRPLTVPGDSGSGPVTNTMGWRHLGERTRNVSIPKAQGDRAPPACPGITGFFPQSGCTSKASFKNV